MKTKKDINLENKAARDAAKGAGIVESQRRTDRLFALAVKAFDIRNGIPQSAIAKYRRPATK